ARPRVEELRPLDLAVRPAANVVGHRQVDAHDDVVVGRFAAHGRHSDSGRPGERPGLCHGLTQPWHRPGHSPAEGMAFALSPSPPRTAAFLSQVGIWPGRILASPGATRPRRLTRPAPSGYSPVEVLWARPDLVYSCPRQTERPPVRPSARCVPRPGWP